MKEGIYLVFKGEDGVIIELVNFRDSIFLDLTHHHFIMGMLIDAGEAFYIGEV